MSDVLPLFFWQYEINRKWISFSDEENTCLNKAVEKCQKTVTLPTNKPVKKKCVVNLDKMIEQNSFTGYIQRVRCAISNKKFYTWLWQDEFGNFTCFTPRVSFFLEIAFNKKLPKVKYSDGQTEYEIDFFNMEQKNIPRNYSCAISRENIDYKFPKVNMTNYLSLLIKSEDLIKKFARESEENIKNVIFGLPPSSVGADIFDPSTSQSIMAALTELPTSSSTSNVAVDPECPHAKNTYVYLENSVAYCASLNLSDLRENNNKYFIIQLLKYINEEKYAVWFRWGRVGYKGQSSFINCGMNLQEAKEIFEKKFYDKTHNNWSEKNSFVRVPRKYDLLQTDFSAQASLPVSVVESKLESSLQDLMKIICDKKSLEDAAREMEFDSSVTPLGKITSTQIKEGYNALNEVINVLKNEGVGVQLIEACNKFYTKIPHNFGKKTPPIITTMEVVKEKLKMLEALSNICLAFDVMSSSTVGENPIDKYYRQLQVSLIPVSSDSEEFKELSLCLLETQGPTHNYKLELISAFKCVKEIDNSNFKNFGNNKLLWHGSRVSNFLGILKKGLQIAPPEAPSTGFMFGKGIYFADICSKSANYCFPTIKNPEGLLILCEVSLGNSRETFEAQDYSKSLENFNSVFAVGKHQPNFKHSVLSSEALLPCGPLKETELEDLTLNYNEYVIYNRQQVKMLYLLRIRFHF